MNAWDRLHMMARRCHYVIWLYDLRGFIGYTRLGPCSYIREYTFIAGDGVKSICASVYTINPNIARWITATYGEYKH